MPRVVVRLYAELNDRLPEERRLRPLELDVPRDQPAGEALRGLGIEPGEVELILLNGAPAPLSRPLVEGDRLAAYPVFEAFDVSPLLRDRSRPLRETRFCADPALARLAVALRLAGFDCESPPAGTNRILLTREPVPAGATHALRIVERSWLAQLDWLFARLHLASGEARCSRCNAPLGGASACPACGRRTGGGLRARIRRRWHRTTRT
jgi:uncharacterized protein